MCICVHVTVIRLILGLEQVDTLTSAVRKTAAHISLHYSKTLNGKSMRLKTQHSKNKDQGIRSHHFMANRWGKDGNSKTLFSWVSKLLQMVTAAMKLKDACSLEEK